MLLFLQGVRTELSTRVNERMTQVSNQFHQTSKLEELTDAEEDRAPSLALLLGEEIAEFSPPLVCLGYSLSLAVIMVQPYGRPTEKLGNTAGCASLIFSTCNRLKPIGHLMFFFF